MGASITIAGESLIAQKQGNKQILDVTQIIFAFVPGLDTTLPVDRSAGLPDAADVVYTTAVTRKGYLSPNRVVFSTLLGSDIGDFDFNWMGLVTAEGVPLIVAYVPTQQKRREIPPLQSGNNLTRNIVLDYDGARSLTGITVPASTWQFDFTTEFASIRDDIAALKIGVANAANVVSLDGAVLIYPNSSNAYKITDYSRFSVYSATTSLGTVAIASDTLTLTIPAGAAAGVVVLDVLRDGIKTTFKVALGAQAIGAPTLTSPANNAVGVALGVTLTTSAFVAYPATADTHKDTDWIIKNAAGDVVWQSLANSTNKTTITLPAGALQPGVQYFPLARHNGVSLGSSAYSAVSKFTTSAVSISTPTILQPINGATEVDETPTFMASAFATVPAASDTQKSANWRLRNAAGDVIWSSMNDTVNLTSIKLPAGLLVVSKNHTIEVQYNGMTLPSTPWQSSGFITKSAFVFDRSVTMLTATAGFRIGVYGQDIDTLRKLDTPNPQPSQSAQAVAYSYDGVHMALAFSSAPYLQIYKKIGNDLTLLPSPSVMPTGFCTAVAFSDDGLYMAVACEANPGLLIYKRAGDVFTYVAYTGASVGSVIDMCFGPNSAYLFIGSQVSPPNFTIARSGNDWQYVVGPSNLPVSNGAIRRMSIAGPYVAFGSFYAGSISCFRVYANNNWVQLTVNGAFTGIPNAIALSDDGAYIAVALSESPFIAIYKRTGDVWNILPTPAGITVQCSCVSWSKDGQYLVFGGQASPFIFVLKRDGDSFVKLANPAVLPSAAPYAIAYNPPGLGA
jgi:WD40 repeat protein